MNTRTPRATRSVNTPLQKKAFVSAGFDTPLQQPSNAIIQVPVVQEVKTEAPMAIETIPQEIIDYVDVDKQENQDQEQNQVEVIEGKRKWPKNGTKKKTSVRERRMKQNRTLRKMLTPKNALMALNEMNDNKVSEYNIMPEEQGFVAEVLVNNVRYEGRGSTKLLAKSNASEKALRDLIIQKMVMRPKQSIKPKHEQTDGANGEDVEMTDADNDVEEVPMMHLASFALHKLFTEWQAEGFEIPDFKNMNTPVPTSTSGLQTPVVKKIPTVRNTLPDNADLMHPSMILSMMRPATTYVQLGSHGNPPAITHRIGINVDGKQYIGEARNKKLARKSAAIACCNELFNTNYVMD